MYSDKSSCQRGRCANTTTTATTAATTISSTTTARYYGTQGQMR